MIDSPILDQATTVSLPLRPSAPSENPPATSESPSDAAMRNAFDRYKKQMQPANQNFIKDRINEISNMDLTEKQKLDLLARFWFDRSQKEWPSPSAITHPDLQQREKNATSIEDIRHFELLDKDGMEPPTLLSEESRAILLMN
jgi:hypothetical protein